MAYPRRRDGGPVDKAVQYSVYREPGSSVYREPEVRSIGNRNRPQTRRNAGLQRPLTKLTTILIGLLLNAKPSVHGFSAT